MRAIAIVILLAFASAALHARGESRHFKSDAMSNEEQRVLTLEQQWAYAEVKHDAVALERILDDEFVVSYSSGKPMDKAAFIAHAMTSSMASQTVSHDVTRIHGNTAIIVGTTIIRPLNSSEPAQSYRYTTVYVKRHGRWFGIAEQLGPGGVVDPVTDTGAARR